MGNTHKPLQRFEVPLLWHKYIQWDIERRYVESKGFHICIECPLCGKLHWTQETRIRTRRCRSPNCQGCNARKVLIIDDVSDVWKPLILWDKEGERKRGIWAMWVQCPSCKEERLITEANLRGKVSSTGLCKKCSVSLRSGHRNYKWNGGRKVSKKGYVLLNLNGLDESERKLAEQMLGKSRRVIREHRLVMALHLKRPLTTDEVVHHRDGHRANNKIENLELLTKKMHHSAHGNPYYLKWQEALSRIRELEVEIEILKG